MSNRSDATKLREAARLHAAWLTALDAQRHNVNDLESIDRAEEDAYDELVEYVEANDLNYSRFDPRNGA